MQRAKAVYRTLGVVVALRGLNLVEAVAPVVEQPTLYMLLLTRMADVLLILMELKEETRMQMEVPAEMVAILPPQ